MIYAAVAAGGSGLRMGSEIPKQFIELCGKPILVHTLEAFLKNEKIGYIYIGINALWLEYTKEILVKFLRCMDRIVLVPGGDSRNGTIRKIIEDIKRRFGIGPMDIILTHDAVRPFISDEIIEKNIQFALESGVCGTYLPAVDTIAVSECGNYIKEVPDRQHMYQVQTPQSFNLELLDRCFERLGDEAYKFTDTCAVCSSANLKIRMVDGDYRNIKITTPFDLVVARAILTEELK